VLERRTAQRLEIARFGQNREMEVLSLADIAWLARILWVSQ